MLIKSISGVRGLVETSFTLQTVPQYANAVHKILSDGAIILGRDSRPSGEGISTKIVNELVRLGRNVIDCGIVPTPTVQFMVGETDSAGGIIVTASHNPIEWNGLKFVREDGVFFFPKECEELYSLVEKPTKNYLIPQAGMYWQEKNSIQKHIIHIAELSCIDLNKIRQRKFKVVIDAVNGAGAVALPAMLEALGCEVIQMNCTPSGEFTRGTEPLPENLHDLCQTVKDNKADAGFATDPDADRLAIVSEAGVPLGEEYTLVLAAEGYMKLKGTPETFVVNQSTSMALEKTAEKYGYKVVRASVGEINVVKKMLELKSNFGGEGNGGIILKEAHLGRDSLVAVTLVLNRMAQDEISLSKIFSDLPQYKIIKDKINLETIDIDSALINVKERFSNVDMNTEDGIKFIWKDKWIHLRKSNTEPIMRIYAEAAEASEALHLIKGVKSAFTQKN